MQKNSGFVTASEVGEYTYCPKCWWEKGTSSGFPAPQLVLGRLKHSQLFSSWSLYQKTKALTVFVIVLVVAFLLLMGIVYVMIR